MSRGRKVGFHHSEETKAKMRGKRKLIEKTEEDLDLENDKVLEEIEVSK